MLQQVHRCLTDACHFSGTIRIESGAVFRFNSRLNPAEKPVTKPAEFQPVTSAIQQRLLTGELFIIRLKSVSREKIR